MLFPDGQTNRAADRAQQFATTSWSIVLAAGQGVSSESRRALEALCETYWLPVYAYARRLAGSADEAQDLTQGFFAHLLEQEAIAKATPDRGRFRAFLLTALQNFVANQRAKDRTQKRGGRRQRLSLDFAAGESCYQREPSHDATPEKLYERRWVLNLIDQVLDALKAELAKAGKESQFEPLKAGLLGEMTRDDYEQTARTLGSTPEAARQLAYRLRKRYRELFRLEVARTVADPAEVDDEIGRLLNALKG